MRWAQRHTDIAAREGRGVGGTQQILYTIFHNFVYLLLTNGTPFTYLAYNFVSVLTAGNPHCHKIGISHKYRTLSRRVRSWTSGWSLPYKYLLSTSAGFQAEPPRIGHHTGSTLPPGIAGNNHIPGQIKLSLCTDVPPPSEKIRRRDACESPTMIVFPFPRFFLREGGRLYTG